MNWIPTDRLKALERISDADKVLSVIYPRAGV